MSDFNREKYNRLIRTKMFDLGDKQNKEFKDLFEIHNKNNSVNSSIFLKARLELKEKHFKERLNVIIVSLIKCVSPNSKIDENDKKIFYELVTARGYIEQEKNGLRSALISYGLIPPNAIIDQNINALENHLNSILYNARDILELAIDEHNSNVKPIYEKKSSDNWNRYGEEIIIGIIVTVIGGLILFYFLSAI